MTSQNLRSSVTIRSPFFVGIKVKFSHTRYRALGPELIPVYRQSAQWLNYSARAWWIPVGARLEGSKLEPEGPIAEVGFPTADQGFSSIQGTLLRFYGI